MGIGFLSLSSFEKKFDSHMGFLNVLKIEPMTETKKLLIHDSLVESVMS